MRVTKSNCMLFKGGMMGQKRLLQLAIFSLILIFFVAQFSFAGVNAAPHLNIGAGARSLGMEALSRLLLMMRLRLYGIQQVYRLRRI